MARWGWVAAVAVIAAMGFAGAARGEVSRAEIEAAIERGVKEIIAKQAEDGHWPTFIGGRAEEAHYNTGHTALAVMALQHSGSKSPEAALAIKKGMSWILQQPPEVRTYSAGTVLQALYADNPTGHTKPVTAYAWMLCGGQKREGTQVGSWGYLMPPAPKDWQTKGLGVFGAPPANRSDNSNSQFAILGLVFAQRSGFQVPRVVWESARKYYIASQHANGGWDYESDAYRATLTAADPEMNSRGETTSMTLGARYRRRSAKRCWRTSITRSARRPRRTRRTRRG